MAYATQAEFEAHVEGWVTDNPAILARLLARASLDVDRMAGPWSVEGNGLKFGAPAGANEKYLSDAQVAALMRATCAQALTIFNRPSVDGTSGPGDDPAVRRTKGPDFEVEYFEGARSGGSTENPDYSPVAYDELCGAGLVRQGVAWV